MNQGNEQLNFIVEFTVSYDKNRGIVIEKLAYENDEYFFKHQDMPLSRHCLQIQQMVRSIGIQRSKKIRVDTTEFSYEYFADGVSWFKRCRLSSVKQQMKKVADSFITKEIAAKKRTLTVAQNKGKKSEEKNLAILERMNAAHEYYRTERARRMGEVFGVGVQNPSTSDVPVNPATEEAPPQVRKVVLPLLPGASSPLSPVGFTVPCGRTAFNSQTPTEPMDQDLPDLPDDDNDI